MHGEKNIKRPLVTFLKQTKQIYSLSFHSFESDQDLSSLLSLHLSNNLFFLEVSPLNVCMIDTSRCQGLHQWSTVSLIGTDSLTEHLYNIV